MTPRFQRESPYYSACRRAPRARVSGALAELLFGLRQGLSLGIPVSCAGCGRWETALCPSCRALLRAPPFAVEHAGAAAGLPILALAPYAGPVRAMVLAWKSGRREDLSAVMEEAGAAGGAAWAAALGGSGREALLASRGLLVVPAPSGAARRLRGGAHRNAMGARPGWSRCASAEPCPARPAGRRSAAFRWFRRFCRWFDERRKRACRKREKSCRAFAGGSFLPVAVPCASEHRPLERRPWPAESP